MSGTGVPLAAGTSVADTLDPKPVAQFVALARRSIAGSVRQVPMLLPSLIFPMFFVAINSSSFHKSLPLLQRNGYPKLHSFLTFTLAATVIQGVMFGCVQGATDLATDIQLGFFERMIAAPASRIAILVARLAGSVVIGIVQGAVFTLLLMLFGARIAAGVPGFVVLLAASGLLALAFGGLLASAALRTGSAEAVQGAFPIVFVLLFASSAFFPRQTMRGLFKRFAGFNPISHVVEGMRELIINGWSGGAAAKALLVPLALAACTFALAARSLQKRLAAA